MSKNNIENGEDMIEFYDILKQLIRIPSVVGAEHSFFMFTKRELEEIGVSVEYYDGVLVAKGDMPESGYISAHVYTYFLISYDKQNNIYKVY